MDTLLKMFRRALFFAIIAVIVILALSALSDVIPSGIKFGGANTPYTVGIGFIGLGLLMLYLEHGKKAS